VITVQILVNHTINEQTINDILIDGLLGGGWATVDVDDNGDCLYRSKEDPEIGVMRVNEATVINGLSRLDPKGRLLRAICFDDWDAVDADMVIQYGLFGEVIYG